MDDLDDMPPEVARLTPEQREQVLAIMRLRRRAAEMATELERDPGDVYHQLRQLQRTPLQRLRRGLAHGRRRRRLPE